MDNNEQQTTIEYAPTQEKKGKGLAATSLIFGVLSLLTFLFIQISLPCILIGLVTGLIALKKRTSYKGMAIAGLVGCCIALIIMLVFGFAASISIPARAPIVIPGMR